MACITEATSGFPNANGHIPFENVNLAEVLGEHGRNTYAIGKWHRRRGRDEPRLLEAPMAAGSWLRALLRVPWGETNQWYPDLVYDNHPVAQPASPEEGYHCPST